MGYIDINGISPVYKLFNPKIYIADFGNFKQGFLSTKLIKEEYFQAQGMFCSTIVLILTVIKGEVRQKKIIGPKFLSDPN